MASIEKIVISSTSNTDSLDEFLEPQLFYEYMAAKGASLIYEEKREDS